MGEQIGFPAHPSPQDLLAYFYCPDQAEMEALNVLKIEPGDPVGWRKMNNTTALVKCYQIMTSKAKLNIPVDIIKQMNLRVLPIVSRSGGMLYYGF